MADNTEYTVGKRDKIRLYPDRNGEYRWKRVAPNGRIISDSAEGYTSRRDMIHGMRRANADWNTPAVRIVDHSTVPIGEDND